MILTVALVLSEIFVCRSNERLFRQIFNFTFAKGLNTQCLGRTKTNVVLSVAAVIGGIDGNLVTPILPQINKCSGREGFVRSVAVTVAPLLLLGRAFWLL